MRLKIGYYELKTRLTLHDTYEVQSVKRKGNEKLKVVAMTLDRGEQVTLEFNVKTLMEMAE
jgi:hypothetical protein